MPDMLLSDKVTQHIVVCVCVKRVELGAVYQEHAGGGKGKKTALRSFQARAVRPQLFSASLTTVNNSILDPEFIILFIFSASKTFWPRSHPVVFPHLQTDHWSKMKTMVRVKRQEILPTCRAADRLLHHKLL